MVTRKSDQFTIRRETPGDHQEIRLVNLVAFGGPLEANLVEALRDGGHVNVSLVAEAGGHVVGHILFSKVHIVAGSETIEATSLAPLAVLPEFQRQGIGSALVRTGLVECRAQGQRIAVVLGHPEFYARHGFSAELARTVESPFGGGEAWRIAELVPHAMAGLQGRLEYPAPFRMFE